MRRETKLIHQISGCGETGAISTPIYQTSTFVQDAPGVNRGYDYARSNNPTRAALESLIAELEGGSNGYAFASGLAAVDAVVKLLSAGDHIVAVDDIYGGSYRSFTHIYEKLGIEVSYVDTSDPVNVAEAIRENTKLVWLESPTNPTLKVSDISAICEIAHRRNALVVVDNTFASPILQRPIEFGADIIIHSATKYLAGHSDVIAGLVVTKTPELGEQIKFVQNATGGILGPFDSWLTIRGIETADLRVRKQSESALKIARWLQSQPEVDIVNYPGLVTHPNHEVAKKQQEAFGGVISFSLVDDTQDAAIEFVTKTELFQLAESLGGVKSLLCHPATMTHKSTPREHRLQAGIHESTVRLSVGIEAAEDLIEDLQNTFVSLQKSEPCLEKA
ncbi:trans-sulfuration enzyme family protein [Phaeocystidibacter luteus]|uniref:PLP-dependent transferase n=1 Tax=Phaeocystidibacter luteus TaxID=911197 RepID=A0A6N6RLY5_9FLAO|nr:PLP-dependent aspartate aminotransferase family protein [Phaeocystidibacter luteus]KAB2814624.1 PLP-dependent transferase [Phaeocystidibacter luteus]